MTDPKALIAEARDIEAEASARAAQALTQGQGAPAAFLSRVAQNARRLATALEEATVPDGWAVTRYDNTETGAIELDNGVWHVGQYEDGQVFIVWRTETFPTAREAMAALDGAAIDTSA